MQTEYIDLITIDELCELLMIGRTTAYRLLRSKGLKAFKIGRVWKISKASVECYIRQRSNL
ncbi:MAG: helix-turn-helix domain-containing protein [Ruminococcaceae bacterium]|nr:helix-turn-helix domain-containing protein [Oscillospiraceae bacterium]